MTYLSLWCKSFIRKLFKISSHCLVFTTAISNYN